MNRATLQSGSGFQPPNGGRRPSPHFQRARAGMGMPLTAIKFGETIASAPARKWKHPWFTRAAWSAAAGRWVATVEPGFVNEKAPVYRATVAEQKAAGNPWENNPLTGQQFFSAPIFAQQSTAVATQSVDLPLYLNPAIALDFRGLGFDGDPNASVPQFFLNMGVAKAPQQPSALAQLVNNAQPVDATPPKNLRLLRACDLWIHQPRLGLTSTFAPGGLGGAPYVQQLGVAGPAASDALRLVAGTFTPFTALTAGIGPLSSDHTEPTWDELHVSTVYLLSPPNTPLGSQPDATWQPFVRHNLFWNLNWAQPELKQTANDLNVSVLPPLAGGAASVLLGIYQSLLADAQQTALNILLGASLAGSFWTPTGGGHDATSPISNLPSPISGPDRAKNAAAKLPAQQQQRRAVQLDPDFPYNARPFPTAFLTP